MRPKLQTLRTPNPPSNPTPIMDSETIFIEISSDEDDDDEKGAEDEVFLSAKAYSTFPNWIPDVLEKGVGFDSEVVVVDSLSCAAAVGPKRKDVLGFDDDDDCVILDGDPDKPVDVVKGGVEAKTVKAMEEESDDLIIVAEKGQLACRDYPHSRHLCATFPFSNTPHENYCDQCHCYVCDILAPCAMWGNGKSTSDHCHSTDKEGMWKLQRSSLKQGVLLKDLQKVSNTSFSKTSSYHNNKSTSSIPAATLPHVNGCLISQQSLPPSTQHLASLLSQQLPISNTLQPCSAHQQHQQHSKFQFPYLSHVNHRVQRERPGQGRILSPRMHPGSSNFKRSGSVRDSCRSVHVHTSSGRQHGVTNNQPVPIYQHRNQFRPVPIHRQRNEHRPVPIIHQDCQPHQSQHPSSTVMSEKNDEHPQILPVNAPANSTSLQHMLLADLESHLGLSDNGRNYNFPSFSPFSVSSQTTSWNTPNTEMSDDNSNFLSYPLCTVSHQPDVCPSRADVNLFQNSPPTTTSQQPAAQQQQQPTNLPVLPLNGNIDSVPTLPSGDWMSMLGNVSPDICDDPAVPPGLSLPGFLPTFDFEVEDTWPS